MKRTLIACLLGVAISLPASAGKFHRSRAQVNLFKRTHVCPATGTTLKSRESCKGYVIDHVRAIECGGPDLASNMQYQTAADAALKDIEEHKCRRKTSTKGA